MPRPDTVFNPMTGRHDARRSKNGRRYGGDKPWRAEPLHEQLGISEHRLAAVNGNIEKISIRGTRIA